MTDEQIVKALECCCSLDTTACGKCPYFKQRIGKECVSMSTKDAIALIKRQREEKEEILETLKTLTYDYRELEASVKFHKAEIRAEAIREFVERIWELFPSDRNFTTISRLAILQIAREMTEEQK